MSLLQVGKSFEKKYLSNTKKIKQKLSKTIRLNFCHLNEIMLVIMKMRVNYISRRYDIQRSRSRHVYGYTKYKTCLIMIVVMCNKQHLNLNPIKKLSNTEAQLLALFIYNHFENIPKYKNAVKTYL